MPPEYYLGAAVAVILLVLLGVLLRRGRATRQVLDKSSTDQLASQLSRIADSLEKLVAHLGTSPPRLEEPSIPLQKPPEPPEPSAANPEKSGEPKHQHVSLSMFGR